MVRNFFSVVIGYVVWTVIFIGVGIGIALLFPEAYDENGMTSDVKVLSMLLGLCFVASLAAGFATAKIAGSKNLICAAALCVCLLGTGIPVQLASWDQLPLWYNLVFLGILAPITMLGAALAGGLKSKSEV